MARRIPITCLALTLSVVSCAKPPSEGTVADYYLLRDNSHVEFEVARGLFRIEAYGKRVPFAASMATTRDIWAEQAKQLCKSDAYEELVIQEHYVTHNVAVLQPHKDAYALCSSSGLSTAKALTLIAQSRQ